MIPLDGPFYDRLSVGQELPRQPAVTIDAGMAALYQSWVGERLPMALDAAVAAAVTGRAGQLASAWLVMRIPRSDPDRSIPASTRPSSVRTSP